MSPAPDTIVAPATPVGESALAVVRLSGPAVPTIGAAAFGTPGMPQPRRASLRTYHSHDQIALDRAIVTYFPDNQSFTGEPLLEISTHGNPILVEKIVQDCIHRGARLAEPGEFTRRAFLNGRLDLTQAEAIADLIHARSDAALRVAHQQLEGDLGKWIAGLTESLLEVIAAMEAYIDFPEEDLPDPDEEGPIRRLHQIDAEIEQCLRLSHYRNMLQDGIKTVILGAPNAGKSSLINRLLGEERALVSPEPGTTRDYLRERLRVGPHCVQIIDTAGLRTSGDPLEQRGMEKTISLAAEADFFLLILDGTAPAPQLPPEVIRHLSPKNTLVLVNKSDLSGFSLPSSFLPDFTHLPISLLSGSGWPEFEAAWSGHLASSHFNPPEEAILVNARHSQALLQIRGHFKAALQRAGNSVETEWLVADLRQALDAFGDILGKIDNEAMLDILFRNFCIGK